MHVGEPIRDIDSNEIIAYQANYVATAVVKAPGEVSKAVLTEGAREALAGDRLITEEGERSLAFRPHAPTTAVDGQIIAHRGWCRADRAIPGGGTESRRE